MATQRSSSLGPINVTLCGKRVFADLMKLRILTWEDDPRLSRWTLNAITGVPVRRGQRQVLHGQGGGHVKSEAQAGGTQPQPRDTDTHQRLEEAGRVLPPLEPSEGGRPY